MKKIMPLLLIAVLAFGAYYVFTSGMLTGTGDVGVNAPDSPNLPDAPDADEVGDAAGDAAKAVDNGAKTAADTIAGLDPAVWKLFGVIIVILGLMWIWKDPKRRSIALGLALVGVVVFIIGQKG